MDADCSGLFRLTTFNLDSVHVDKEGHCFINFRPSRSRWAGSENELFGRTMALREC